MKHLLLTSLTAACLSISGVAQTSVPAALPQDKQIEQKISNLISKMSLDQKVGQMLQFSVDQITYNNPEFDARSLMQKSPKDLDAIIRKYGLEHRYDAKKFFDENGKFDMKAGYDLYMLSQDLGTLEGFKVDQDKMKRIFGDLHIGSILNMLGGSATEAAVWNRTIRDIHASSSKYIQDIPMLYGLDQVHGTTYTSEGTLFPQHIGMAATFNPELAKRMGEICAYETRACGVAWIFCPDLDLGRKASWSRIYEGMGEDPYAASVMGIAYLKGLQGDDPNHIDKYHVGTCLKHYFGYGIPDNGLDRTPANASEQDLRERYYEPFKNVFKAGALSAMTNSSLVNGMNGVANKRFLTDWLKRDLNWDGMIITDWGDIENLHVRDHIASTKKEAIMMAINAGVDMMMVTADPEYFTLTKELVNEGSISMERVDDAVRRVLRLKYRLGLFENPNTDLKDYPLLGSKEHAAVAKQMAIESEILLKNEGNILPLKKGSKILVCGPNSNTMRGLNGGWSYTWQGSNTEKFTAQYNTILEAMQLKFGKENIVYEEGVSYNNQGNWQEELTPEIDKAVAAAAGVDYILVCIGENSYAETSGNIVDANLSQNQKELVLALQKTGKPVIMILNQGRPRLIHELVPGSKAIVNVMLPGNYGGDALADLIAGDANFSGRMPFTYPSYPNAFTTYDYKFPEYRETMPGIYNYNAETNAEWWFGAGLSYTTFEYANLKVDKTSFNRNDELTFTVDVKNAGQRAGKEVVMLYSTDLYAKYVTPDNKRLRAFEKIELNPGETKTVTFKLKGEDLAYVNGEGKWTLDSGDFDIKVDKLKIKIACQEDYIWSTPNK